MKYSIAAAMVLCAPLCAGAQTAFKPCEDLKSEIAKKLEAKGVTNYTLNIVDKGKEAEGKVVGSCNGGAQNIVYLRAAPASQSKPAAEKKPQ